MKKFSYTLMALMLFVTAVNAAEVATDQSGNVESKKYARVESEGQSLTSRSMDASDASEGKEHIQPGSRAMSHNEYVAEQEKRSLELKQETSKKSEENISSEFAKESEDEELSARGYYYNSHEGAYHRAVAVSYYGDQVTLEDGSLWNVSSWDAWKTLNWYTTDTILVMQNKWMFSSYKFMLVNQNTGKEVEVNLALGPYYLGAYTHWIVAIDYYNSQIILEDNSVWDMNFFDSSIINKWLINDTVIIGVNESGSSLRPNILINVNVLNYARGICLN